MPTKIFTDGFFTDKVIELFNIGERIQKGGEINSCFNVTYFSQDNSKSNKVKLTNEVALSL